MTLTHRPAAFLFDLDGVVVASRDAHMMAYDTALADEKIRFTAEARALVGEGGSRSQVLDTLAVPKSRRQVVMQRKADAFEAMLRAGDVVEVEGCRRLLERLRDHEVPVALVSNSREAAGVVEVLGLEWAFRAVVGGGETEPKPSPAPFLLAAKRLGVSARQSVVIEDSAMGARAGRSAGAFVIVLGAAGECDFRAHSFAAIPLDDWLQLPPWDLPNE